LTSSLEAVADKIYELRKRAASAFEVLDVLENLQILEDVPRAEHPAAQARHLTAAKELREAIAQAPKAAVSMAFARAVVIR
jgi:hypothetical protein